MSFGRIMVGDNIGSITAWCEINSRKGLFGISAAHVLTGSFGGIDDREIVDFFDRTIPGWIPIGKTAMGIYTPGQPGGNDEQWGKMDAGLFEVRRETEERIGPRLRAIRVHPLVIERRYRHLEGTNVFSYSQMLETVISGTIVKVFGQSGRGNQYDLVIESNDPEYFTDGGDSGILWRDINGLAIGMHTNGNRNPANVSFASFINRMSQSLDVFKLYGIFAS